MVEIPAPRDIPYGKGKTAAARSEWRGSAVDSGRIVDELTHAGDLNPVRWLAEWVAVQVVREALQYDIAIIIHYHIQSDV